MSYPTFSARGRKPIAEGLLARLDAVRTSTATTSRDRTFLDSLFENAKIWGNLSPRQYAALERVEQRIETRTIAHNDHDAWMTEWDSEKAELFSLFLSYASSTKPSGAMNRAPIEYYGRFLSLVKADENFIPTRGQFSKYTGNLYFQRALAEYRRSPKFAINGAVTFRSTANSRCDAYAACRRAHVGTKIVGMVTEIDPCFPRTSVKGSKTYRVVFPQLMKQFIVEERWLKLSSRKKS